MMLFAFGPGSDDRREDPEFRAFWACYPRRVGKLDAQKAYKKARKLASAEAILDGVERYKRTKPDWQDWAHPSTWLNKGRWMDEEDVPVVKAKPECRHDPPCYNVWACLVRTAKEGELHT